MEAIPVVIIAGIAILFYWIWRKGLEKKARNAACPKCKQKLGSKDIVGESLKGDGIDNSKRTRKINVSMRCPVCGEEIKLLIYTKYRHHEFNGTPAQQYFRDLELQDNSSNGTSNPES